MAGSNDPKAQLGLYDEESEELLLAAVLKSDRLADEIIPRVQMEMFGDIVRQYIFGAAAELRRHGYAVTADGIVAKARELAVKNRLRTKDIVKAPAVKRLLEVNIEGIDVVARATTVANMWSLRGYADSIEGLVEMIATRPEPDAFRSQLLALLSSVSMRQGAAGDGIYYGYDADARLGDLLERLDGGRIVRFAWPWRAFDFVAPLPPGFCSLWGMPDGTGKSATAEAVARFNASQGYTVAYVATEYEQEILDARILSQISGAPVNVILAGGYTPALRKELQRARAFYAEQYPTLHYVSGSGLSMSQIVGKLYSLAAKPDLIVVDYLGDIAFERGERDRTERSNNAMQLFHSTLKSIGCAGFVLSQFVKLGYQVLDPTELSRTLLNLGAPALSKSQATFVANRNRLDHDGGDIDWDENGVVLAPDQWIGRRGKHSRIMQVNLDKQTLGDPGYAFLEFTANQVVRDLPPRVVDYLGGRVTVRDPEEGERTLMAKNF